MWRVFVALSDIVMLAFSWMGVKVMPGINQLGGAQVVNVPPPQTSATDAAAAGRVRIQSTAEPAPADAVKAAAQVKATSKMTNKQTAEAVQRQTRRFKTLRAQTQRAEVDRVNLANGRPTGSVDNTETERILEKNRQLNARSAAKSRAKAQAQQSRIASATKAAVQETNKEVSQLQRAMKDLFAPRPGGRK